jgi:hypothetical protein
MAELSNNAKAVIESLAAWDREFGEDIVVYGEGLFYASVCTALDDSAADAAMAARAATGTHGWSRSADTHFEGGATNPCPCDQYPDSRRHILYEA